MLPIGLEFSDVLLYRFFDKSPAEARHWRVLLSLLDGQEAATVFSETKHSVLLPELRQLYVAVTRARNRIWIFDTSTSIEPVKQF